MLGHALEATARATSARAFAVLPAADGASQLLRCATHGAGQILHAVDGGAGE